MQLPIGRRLQLDLGGPVDAGYQQAGDALRGLPVGSTLDAGAGIFAREQPAGFLGPLQLIFTAGPARLEVTVTIVDGTRAPAPIAMHVDALLDGWKGTPGIYDITVYSLSHLTTRWEDTRTVRVTIH